MIRRAAIRGIARNVLAEPKPVLVLQGSLAIAFGLAAMLWPGLTARALAYLFAAFLLGDGCLLLILAVMPSNRRAAAHHLLWGFLQVAVGLLVLQNPDVTFSILIMLLGITLLLRGVFYATHGALQRHHPPQESLMHGVLGALGIIVGTVIVLQPAAGGLAFVWVLGLYALTTGAVLQGRRQSAVAKILAVIRREVVWNKHH